MMRSDSVVRTEGMNILLNGLGKVDAERFISLILREPFDYTEWRESLNEESIDLRELSRRATEYCNSQNSNNQRQSVVAEKEHTYDEARRCDDDK